MSRASKVSPESFQEVVRATELLGVSLQSCSTTCNVVPASIDPQNTELSIDQKTREWEISGLRNGLVCYVDVSVSGTSGKAQDDVGISAGETLFEISASFALMYELKKEELDDEAIGLFARRNAAFNAYPFLREFVDSMSRRMGLPQIVLPLLKSGLSGKGGGAKRQIAENKPKS